MNGNSIIERRCGVEPSAAFGAKQVALNFARVKRVPAKMTTDSDNQKKLRPQGTMRRASSQMSWSSTVAVLRITT